MQAGGDQRSTWMSRIILVDENATLIIDDTIRIAFHHRATFRLLWTICKAITDNPEYSRLGGVPIDEVEKQCGQLDFPPSRTEMNTRWREEIQFDKITKTEPTDYAAQVLKCIDISLLRDGMIPPQMTKERFAVGVLRRMFSRQPAPPGLGFPVNLKLFCVQATPDTIRLFNTWADAKTENIDASGTSELTKFGIAPWDMGFFKRTTEITVSPDTKSEHVVTLNMVNLSPYPLPRYSFEIWTYQQPACPVKPPEAWLADKTPLYTVPKLRQACGYATQFLDVFFPKPIMSGKRFVFSYRFIHPCPFSRGDNTYIAHVGNPHKIYEITVHARPGCFIDNPRVYVESHGPDSIQPIVMNRDSFVWSRMFPAPKIHYTVFFRLSTTVSA